MTPATFDQITAITNASARHWQPFDAVSPGAIPFSGYLCRQESDKLGLLGLILLNGRSGWNSSRPCPRSITPASRAVRTACGKWCGSAMLPEADAGLASVVAYEQTVIKIRNYVY
jgi:hypothetical protein